MRPLDVLRAAYTAERSAGKLSKGVLRNVCLMAEKSRRATQLVGWDEKRRCDHVIPLTSVTLSKEGATGVELVAQCLTREKEWSWPHSLLLRFAVLSGHAHRARESAYTSEVLQRFAAWSVEHAAHTHIAPVAWACAADGDAARIMVAGIRRYVEAAARPFLIRHLLLFVGFASKTLAVANRRSAGSGVAADLTDTAVRADAEAVLEWALTRAFEAVQSFRVSPQVFVALLAAAGSENVERVGRTAEATGYGGLHEVYAAVSRESRALFSMPDLLPGAARALLAAHGSDGYSLHELPHKRYAFIAARSVVEEAVERHSAEGLAMFCLLVGTADWSRSRCRLSDGTTWLLRALWNGITSKLAVDALRFEALSSRKQAEHLRFTLSLMIIAFSRALQAREYRDLFVQLSGYVDAPTLLRSEDPVLQGLLCVYLALRRQGSRFAGDCSALLREAVGAMGRDGCAWVQSMLRAADGTPPAAGATRFETRVHPSRFVPALCFALQAGAGDPVAGPPAARVARCVAQRLAAPATPAAFDARDVDGTLAVAQVLNMYVPGDAAARDALQAMWLEVEAEELPTFYPRLTPKEVVVRASRRRTLKQLLGMETGDNDAFAGDQQRPPSWRGAGQSEMQAATAEAWSVVFAGALEPCPVRSNIPALVSSPVRRWESSQYNQSLQAKMPRFCSFCFQETGSATEAQLREHLDRHPQEVADARYWGAVKNIFAGDASAADGKEDPPRSAFEAELWHSFVQATEDTRQTAEEAAQKHAGMHFLQGLLHGRAVCIPFGSSVIGTAELGQSDTDVSVYMLREAPKFYVSEMLGLHRRDAVRLRDLKEEIEQTTGAYVYVGHLESMVGCGAVLADSADAVLVTLDLIRSGLRKFHERAGIMTPTKPAQSSLSEHMVLCWAHDQFATSLARRPQTTFELLLRTHVPISRMTTEGTSLEDDTLHFQDEECRATFLAFVAEERKLAGDEGAFACNDGASLVFEKPGDALELFQRLQQKKSKEQQRVVEAFRRGVAPPSAGDDAYRLLHCNVKIAVPTSLTGKWDITARPHYGPRNSTLLKQILQSAGEPAFVTCSMIKKWGKVHGVSNSRAGFLSSYALVLMFCFYLQRAGYAEYVEHTSVNHASQLTACPVPRRLSPEERLVCRDLLLGFFRFYTHFDWSKQAVTLRVAPSQEVTSEELGFTLTNVIKTLRGHKKDHAHVLMVVHDPYEEVNCTRRISYPKFMFVSALFGASYALLAAEDTSQLAQLRLRRVLGMPFHEEEEGPESRIPADLLSADVARQLSEAEPLLAGKGSAFKWHDAYLPPVGETIADRVPVPQEHKAPERGWMVTSDAASAARPQQSRNTGPAAAAPPPLRSAVPMPQWQKRPPTVQPAQTAHTTARSAQNWQAPGTQLHPRPATAWPAPTAAPPPLSPVLQGQPADRTNTGSQPTPPAGTVLVQAQPAFPTNANQPPPPPLQSVVLQGQPAYRTNANGQPSPSAQQNMRPVQSQPVYQTTNPTPAQPRTVPVQGQATYQTNVQFPNANFQPTLQQSMVLQGQPTYQTSTNIQPPPTVLQGQPSFQVGNSNPQRVVLASQPAPSGVQARPQTFWAAQAQPQAQTQAQPQVQPQVQVQVQPQTNVGVVYKQ